MNSDLLMKILLFEYIVIMAVCLIEQSWARSLYWFGAILITYSIIVGFK